MTIKNFLQISSAVLFVAGCGGSSVDTPAVVTPPAPPPARAVSTVGILPPEAQIDKTNPFFTAVGTTGTTCEHCHFAENAFGLSADKAKKLFDDSKGTHPLFRPHAANDFVAASALPANATVDQLKKAYSLLLNKGAALARVTLRLPTDSPAAEFTLVGVDDPSLPDMGKVTVDGVGLVGDPVKYMAYTNGQLFLHRRPLPTANERFLTAIQWDVRNTANPNPNLATFTVRDGLDKTALDTIQGRSFTNAAEALTKFTLEQQMAMAQKMTNAQFGLTAAQSVDADAGPLDAFGARGGPIHLTEEDFFFGINDVLGDNPQKKAFTPKIFNLFDAWVISPNDQYSAGRAAILRGQALFNSKPLIIENVAGLTNTNIVQTDGVSTVNPGPTINGTCGTCHDSPNVGNHSTRVPLNIGIADLAPASLGAAAVNDLPIFTLRNNTTGEIKRVTDPGRAIRSGKWAHVGQFKGPILRGLAVRAPFFHNGMATTLTDVVNFYDIRFKAGFTASEKSDLVAFLKAL